MYISYIISFSEVKYLLQVELFNVRVFKEQCELNILMRYGLVQVLNAALTLLSDEDFEIRQKSVRFVYQLKFNYGMRSSTKVGAIKSLVLIGLDYFEDCAEYFLPITELCNLDWTFLHIKPSSQLFESGDGINVYVETAFMNGLYKKVLLDWIAKHEIRPLFTFLNCSSRNLVNQVKSSKDQLKGQNIFGPISSPKGYTKAVKILNFLEIIIQYPYLLKETFSNEDCLELKDFCTFLKTKL